MQTPNPITVAPNLGGAVWSIITGQSNQSPQASKINVIIARANQIQPLKTMKKTNFEKMSLDELCSFYEEVSRVLSVRITAEKDQLEKRLVQLNLGKNLRRLAVSLPANQKNPDRSRRNYPKVFPKYHNPADPSQMWSGRGKQPRWLVSELKLGKVMRDFEISRN